MTTDWLALCRRLAPGILRGRDWRLVSDTEAFARQLAELVTSDALRADPTFSPEELVRRATLHAYSRELYHACGEHGTWRQRRAFQEVGQYAQGVVYHHDHDPAVVQAVAQRTLTITWQKLGQVRQPGSFLRWIEKTTYHELLREWKKKGRIEEIPVSGLLPDYDIPDDALERFWAHLGSVPPPDDELIERQEGEALWAEVDRVLAPYPRHRAVVVGYFRWELPIPTLARLLSTTVGNISVLKHRALERLRADEVLVRRFGDSLPKGSLERETRNDDTALP